ncbi:MAG: DUF3365 domain-containing protein [Candidatus Polarisedimenticolaceae bacterium]|nr:DUF3365 domain-containing protein [Candidatus Polarisedimenticolaceae bacterium]
MKKMMILALLIAVPVASAVADGHAQRADQSRAVVKSFMGGLKGELKGALKSEGPLKAVEVCNIKAKDIAAALSKKHGWNVGRTSLKPRSAANAPDAWERGVLETFETRKAAGEDPKKMEHFEVVMLDGKQVFRYMKAIPTAERPCLVCHGSKLKPEIAAIIDKYYPNDQARGYKAGDIRGAFSIVQPM